MRFITDLADYARMQAQMAELFYFDRHLPEQVFRVRPRRYAFVAYGWIWSADAWPPIAALAKYYGDAEVDVAADAPHAEWWSRDGYPHLGAARIATNDSSEAYRAFAWQDDKYAIHATMPTHLTIVVPSAGFAVWADRGADLAVFGLYDRPGRPASVAPFEFPAAVDLNGAVELLRPGFVFGDPEAFAAAAQELQQNYGVA